MQTSATIAECAACAQVFPLTLFWWLYVVSGVIALRYLNVPMYRRVAQAPVLSAQLRTHRRPLQCKESKPGLVHRSVFRRSTTLIVVGGEWFLLHKRPTPTGFVRARHAALLPPFLHSAVVCGHNVSRHAQSSSRSGIA